MSRARSRALLGAALVAALLPPAAAPQEEAPAPPLAGSGIGVSTPLGDELFVVQRFVGREAISQLFSFEVEATAPRSVPFEALLGKPITVRVDALGAGTRFFHGIVARIGQGDGDRAAATYLLEVVPELWLLGLEQRSRLFQGLSVPEIVDRVLAEAGIPHESRLDGDYPARDCVVQYRESDFAFVSRLLADEGIFYFFSHSAGGHRLMLGDSAASHPSLPGRGEVQFDGPAPGRPAPAPRSEARVVEWTKVQELRPGVVTLNDFDFHRPDLDLEVSASIQESVVAGQVSHRLRLDENATLEVYDYPGEYAQRFDGEAVPASELLAEGERTVAIRMEEAALPSLVVRGASLHAQLVAGHKFSLAGHFDADGEYVLTSVQHHASRASANGDRIEYSNSFTCIPVGLPYRPERATPAPRIPGVQTAIVTGPPGDETHVDELGRVKVRFHWDREGTRDEGSSCWIRVATPSAGADAGVPAAPRIGQEVAVGFVEGDPDQPIILGRVYNGAQRPPSDR